MLENKKRKKKFLIVFALLQRWAELSSWDCTTQMSKWDEMRNWIGWRGKLQTQQGAMIKCATYFPSISAHPDCAPWVRTLDSIIVRQHRHILVCMQHDEKWDAASTWVKWWWIVCRYIMIECQTERRLKDELFAGHKRWWWWWTLMQHSELNESRVKVQLVNFSFWSFSKIVRYSSHAKRWSHNSTFQLSE